jgi:hypothetical protein
MPSASSDKDIYTHVFLTSSHFYRVLSLKNLNFYWVLFFFLFQTNDVGIILCIWSHGNNDVGYL